MKTEVFHQIEGIVLQFVPFKERDTILTLFTAEEGIIKLFVRGSRRLAPQLQALISPFTVGEYLYTQGNSSLHRFHEGKILQQNIRLRDAFLCFEAASKLGQAVLKSQWQGKASPGLYQLFCQCLEKIPTLSTPEALLPLFLLKILKVEGLLHTQPLCNVCNTSLKDALRQGGECFCPTHAPENALLFSEEEQLHLRLLSQSRSFQEILSQDISFVFSQKVATLFDQVFNHS